MSLIRRIITVLVGVSLAALMTVLLLNPGSIATLALNLSDTSALIRLPLAILIDAVVLALIVLLVRSERPAHPAAAGLMVKAQGVIADVSVDSASERILKAVRAVPDVLSTSAEVKAVHGKADVDLEVVVSHDSTDLPAKQREIDSALRQVINKQLGLQMASKARVHIRMDDVKVSPVPDAKAPPALPEVTAPDVVPASGEPELKPEQPAPEDAMTVRGSDEAKPELPNPPG